MSANNHNDNPWEDQHGQQGHQGYQAQSQSQSQNPFQAYQEPSTNPYTQQSGQQHQQHQDTSPWSQEPGHAPTQSHNPYTQAQPQQGTQPSGYPQGAAQSQFSEYESAPPGLPPRRTATDMALPTGQDRSHQIEVMQSYEASGRKDEDDSNVEILQREFPQIDGSLIAAIYGDSKSLSATREMLGALD